MLDTRNKYDETPRDLANNQGHKDVVAYLDSLVKAIDNVRHIVFFMIGIRRGTNRDGMGDLQYLPKDIVLMIANRVWATRRDVKWLNVPITKKI